MDIVLQVNSTQNTLSGLKKTFLAFQAPVADAQNPVVNHYMVNQQTLIVAGPNRYLSITATAKQTANSITANCLVTGDFIPLQ